jgi:DHA1 family bicyclomycin/chloramphenicol resistance-like MFS transporter
MRRPAIPERLSMPEFVTLSAVLFATIAFSIDAMLPALPQIAADLSPADPNRAQLVLTSFVLGMGIGTFFAGPISDTLGRKATINAGIAIYIAGSLWAMWAQTLEALLIARVLQGIGASGPRVVTLAMIRDLYEGRRMAQIVSFVMTVFILIPAFAPSLGAGIIALTGGWQGVFGAFVVFGLATGLWMNLRQRETLPPEARRPFRARPLWEAVREVLTNRMVLIYIAVLSLGFGQMFALLSSIQQLYAETFGRGTYFHFWFMATGLLSAGGTILNAALVMRLGMRRLAITAYAFQCVIAAVLLTGWWSGLMPDWLVFPAFFFWSTSIFFMAGLTFGNLNALALQPMGHIAGMAASVVGAISTVLAVPIAAPIGLAFDGTPVPLLAGTLVCSTIALFLMRKSREIDPEPKRRAPDPV